MADTPTSRKPRWSLGFGPELMRFTLAAVLLLAVLISGIISLRAWLVRIEAQDLQNWQQSAADVAARQVAGLREFIEAQQQFTHRIANRQTVRDGMEKQSWAMPLLADLRLDAARAGYDRTAPEAGIYFTDIRGRQLMTTSGALMPTNLTPYLRNLQPGQNHVHDVFFPANGPALMAFVAPVYSAASEQLGWAVAVRPALDELVDILQRRAGHTPHGRSALVRLSADSRLQFLSPIHADRPAGWLSPSVSTAEYNAVMRPGLLVRGDDLDERAVVALARGVHAMPWFVLHTAAAEQVLEAAQARQLRTMAAFLLAAIMLLLLGLAIWRHLSANRIEVAGQRFGQFLGTLKRQHHFFDTVLNSQPNSIAVLDENNCFIFANSPLARWANIPADELQGRPLADAYGDDAISVVEHNRLAMNTNRPVDTLRQVMRGGSRHILQSRHVPIEYGEPPRRGVLLVEEDITETIHQREQREKALDTLVETILTLIDQRDPDARFHSVRVGEVAYVIADEIGLPRKQREAARMAGRLYNIGKLFVPEALLTKTGKLNEAELATIRAAMQQGCDMVQSVPFEGPVVETLRAVFSREDFKSYPAAPAVAAANRFVAMVSPRAHRASLTVEQALTMLRADTDATIHMALERAVSHQRGVWSWLPKAESKKAPKVAEKPAKPTRTKKKT